MKVIIGTLFACLFGGVSFASEPTDADRLAVSTAIEQLHDSKQSVRDSAAAKIREILARSPAAANDHGEAYWKEKLKTAKAGMTRKEFKAEFGGNIEMEERTDSQMLCTWRLDDYWFAEVRFKISDQFEEIGFLRRHANSIGVNLPENFSGHWVCYYVTGQIESDNEYKNGEEVHMKAYHENGRLSYESTTKGVETETVGFYSDGAKYYATHYLNHMVEGLSVRWYPNGQKQREENYVAGFQHGKSTEWYENGKKSSEKDFDHGNETGMASWDEKGKLLKANGTAAGAKDQN